MKRLTNRDGELLEGVDIKKAILRLSIYEDLCSSPVKLSEQMSQIKKLAKDLTDYIGNEA